MLPQSADARNDFPKNSTGAFRPSRPLTPVARVGTNSTGLSKSLKGTLARWNTMGEGGREQVSGRLIQRAFVTLRIPVERRLRVLWSV